MARDAEICCFLWCVNRRLSKQSISRWFETPLCPLWRHCNANLPRQNALTRESVVMHIVMPCKSIGRVVTRFAFNMRYVHSKEFASSRCVHYSFFPKYLPPNEVLQLRFFVPIEAFPHFLFDIFRLQWNFHAILNFYTAFKHSCSVWHTRITSWIYTKWIPYICNLRI